MIAGGTHVCAQCGGENEEPGSEPRGFCSDECKRAYDRECAAALLTVPDLGPPLPESSSNERVTCDGCRGKGTHETEGGGLRKCLDCNGTGRDLLAESAIPAVPPAAEDPKPSPADITRACIDAVVYLDECLRAYVDAARRVENAQLRWQAARSAKAAQMLADGTRLVSIGGVTYEAKRGRKGAAPTLVPVKVEE